MSQSTPPPSLPSQPSSSSPAAAAVHTARNKRKKELAKAKKNQEKKEIELVATLNATITSQCFPWKPLFEVKQVIGKGLGLVALSKIHKGQEILREDAVLKTNMDGVAKEAGFMAMTVEKKQRFLELNGPCECEDPATCTETAVQKITKHNYIAEFPAEGDQMCNTLVFLTVSRMNHACHPNTTYTITEDKHIVVYAVCEIPAGEELTMRYSKEDGSTEQRREAIQASCGFTCLCKHCVEDAFIVPGLNKKPTINTNQTPTPLLYASSSAENKKVNEVDTWYDNWTDSINKTINLMDNIAKLSAEKGKSREETKTNMKKLGEKIKESLRKNNKFGMPDEVIEIRGNEMAELWARKKLRIFDRLVAAKNRLPSVEEEPEEE